MNRFRLLSTGAMLMVALLSPAQQTATSASSSQQEHVQSAPQNSPSSVDQHLKMLSERLDLTAGQQTKIRPILQQMLDSREKLMQDSSLSSEARAEKQKSLHDAADKQARKFLNDEQKKKLDALEQEPHHHMHGDAEQKAPARPAQN
jgi:Skp family chaperone for outer membrane proteins